MRRVFIGFAVAVVGVGVVVACSSSSDEAAKVGLAQGCALNSECNTPLICVFRRCHNACTETRDCPAGQRCVQGEKPFGACQLDNERQCTLNSQCAGSQVCGVDGHCRDQCESDRDCIQGQQCVSRTCAEKSELVEGVLPTVLDASSGQECTIASDCPDNLVCISGVCSVECKTDKDCPVTWTCIDTRCHPPDSGAR